MNTHLPPFLLLFTCMLAANATPAWAKHDFHGNAATQGTSIKLQETGTLTVKRAPHLRIDARNGKILKRTDGILALRRWEPLKKTTQQNKRPVLTLRTYEDHAPESNWMVQMQFKTGMVVNQDLVVKMSNGFVSELKQICVGQGKKYGKTTTSVSAFAITPTIEFDVKLTTTESTYLARKRPLKWLADVKNKRYEADHHIGVRFECILPRTKLSTGVKSTKTNPSKAKVAPRKTPSVKRPSVRTPTRTRR